MKKFTVALSISAIALLAALPASSEADISVMLNGNTLDFDVPPQIIDGRTLVPLRAIFEALGADVDWNGETRTVTAHKDDTMISMTIGNNVMRINSHEVTLDVPPQIINDRTLVPARAAAEGFGADVAWNESDRTVIITTANTSAEPEKALENTPTPILAPVEKSEEFPISYNSEPEGLVSYASRFKLTSVTFNDEGNYDIEFELFTFMEGRGDVGVSFRCLDENGREVDTFAGMYRGTDYTWSMQTDKKTISGKTATIELVPAGQN